MNTATFYNKRELFIKKSPLFYKNKQTLHQLIKKFQPQISVFIKKTQFLEIETPARKHLGLPGGGAFWDSGRSTGGGGRQLFGLREGLSVQMLPKCRHCLN